MRKPGFVIALTAVLLTAILTAGQTAPVAAPAPDAAQDAPVFKSDVALVKVDAEVLDGERRLLGRFRKEDFRIRDNGAPRSSRRGHPLLFSRRSAVGRGAALRHQQ
jgi:hypothetical protein